MKIKKIDLDEDWHYEGEVSKYNDPHGKGTLTNKKNKSKYIGKFKNGQKHGEGTVFLPDDLKLRGKWKNGIFQGFGIYEFANGQKYEGELKDGKYHGKGTLTMPDGTVVKAIFKESKIVKELKKSNPKNDELQKTILKNLKFIIKNFAPKQMTNGQWVFNKPGKKIISQFKKDPELKEFVHILIYYKFKKFPDLIKKFSIKYNYKL